MLGNDKKNISTFSPFWKSTEKERPKEIDHTKMISA